MALHINIESLLNVQVVESNRIEFKEGWNPNAIYRSICAFANDFDNTGGGYIVIGVEEENGVAKRPVKGLLPEQIASIQKEMIGYNNLIRPVYTPNLFIEEVDETQIIVLWVVGSASRPHEVPEEVTSKEKRFFYYIREYASSVKVQDTIKKQELISLSNQTPFDDRTNTNASIDDISLFWVRDFLQQTKSRLADDLAYKKPIDIYTQMELIAGSKEHCFPRNVTLMLFSETPERFFRYCYIEVVRFGEEGAAGRDFTEITFKGTVQHQIKQFIAFLKAHILVEKVIKQADKAEALRVWNYPLPALEEAIVNAVFHRDYQVAEPIKVFIYQDKIRIQNAGGPDRSVKLEDLQAGTPHPKRYRNRRLGDFLKQLRLTEGHATGIALMLKTSERNGSPTPLFEIDEGRSDFAVTFFEHKHFLFSRKAQTRATRLKRLVNNRNTVQNSEKITQNMLLVMHNQSPMKRKEILEKVGLTNQTKNFQKYFVPLLSKGLVMPTMPEKPTSPLQTYYLTQAGKELVEILQEIPS